jgi:hypothetical protein
MSSPLSEKEVQIEAVRQLDRIESSAGLFDGRDMQGFYMTISAAQADSLGRAVAGLMPGQVLL